MNRWHLPVLLLLAFALCVATAGWGDLYNETDGQYGGAARVMAQGGSWLIPENNGSPRLVKPPLLYWAMAGSMKAFGINAFAARLPSALSLAAWVALTYLIGTRLGNAQRGFLGGLILLTSLGTFTLGRIVMPEPLFSALIAAALYAALRGYQSFRCRRAWFAGFWLCASLASFTKGWHGAIYPLVIMGGVALLCKEARPRFRELISWEGPLIFAAINLPWYFYLESKFPGYVNNLFFAEQLGHITGSDAPATSYTSVPRLQFLLLHIAWFFPWSLAALFAFFPRWRECLKRLRHPSFAAALLLCWSGVVGLSVMLAGQRQDYYSMSLWPAAALAVAWLIEKASFRPAAIFLTTLMATGLVFFFVLPSLMAGKETATVAERATAWTTVINLDAGVWQSLQTTALLALGGGLLGGLVALFARNRALTWTGFAILGISLDIGALSGTSAISPYFSLAKAVPFIDPASRLVYDGGLDTGSSLLFYTTKPVVYLDRRVEEDFIVRKFGVGREHFLTDEEFVALWQAGNPVTLVTEAQKLPEWEKLLGGTLVPVTRCGTQILLKN